MDLFVDVLKVLGGGAVVALINVIAHKGKNKVEADSVLIKSALDIEQIATSRLMTSEERLMNIKKELEDVEKELTFNRRYISYLTGLLKKGGIDYMTAEEFKQMEAS